MISYIRGELTAVQETKAVVDVGGVGYGVFMSSHALGLLPQVGQEVKLHTYLNVKEDIMQLFGFLTEDDLQIFKLIIGVNGIGPKGGQAILSVLSPDELRFAVISSDAKAIAQAPGVGKKTAEKLILELKDKLKIEDVLEHVQQGSGLLAAGAMNNEVQSEVVQALVALGYGSTEALKAVKKAAPAADADVEEVLKLALKHMTF